MKTFLHAHLRLAVNPPVANNPLVESSPVEHPAGTLVVWFVGLMRAASMLIQQFALANADYHAEISPTPPDRDLLWTMAAQEQIAMKEFLDILQARHGYLYLKLPAPHDGNPDNALLYNLSTMQVVLTHLSKTERFEWEEAHRHLTALIEYHLNYRMADFFQALIGGLYEMTSRSLGVRMQIDKKRLFAWEVVPFAQVIDQLKVISPTQDFGEIERELLHLNLPDHGVNQATDQGRGGKSHQGRKDPPDRPATVVTR
jgi:hypothetical protein